VEPGRAAREGRASGGRACGYLQSVCQRLWQTPGGPRRHPVLRL